MLVLQMIVGFILLLTIIASVDRIRWGSWLWQRGGPMDLTSSRKRDKMNITNGPDLSEGHDYHNGNDKTNTR
jgi:hypothetical protein